MLSAYDKRFCYYAPPFRVLILLSTMEIRVGKSTATTLVVPNKPFAAVVGGSSLVTIVAKAPSSNRGEPALFFSDEEISQVSSPFNFALISKFSHGRPSLPNIRAAINSIGLRLLSRWVYTIKSIF